MRKVCVEGRILRASSQTTKPSNHTYRAILGGARFQPEAHTRLGIIYEEKGKYEERRLLPPIHRALSDTDVLYE